MNKNSWNHFKKNLTVILTLIFVLGYANADVYGVSFPDYFPLDASSHGVKTFQWTHGNTGTYSSIVSGTLTVPYTSDAIQGTGIVNFQEGMTLYATNDSAEVKLLSINNAYFSTDQFLTAHPAAWTFSTVTDDMFVDVGSYYDVLFDLTTSYLQEYLAILFDIQDVTTPLGQQNNAVIMWFLDENYPFTSLNFYDKDIDLGITLPDGTQTEGRSVTDFMIFGYGIGMIAVGDIDAESGELANLAELVDINPTLDIERIGIMTELEYLDGSPDGSYPWDFEIDVLVSDPGELHHINVTNPLGASVESETIYQTEPDLWGFDPPKDASLDDLRAKYPEGIYTFEFYDSENSLLKTVSLNYSGLSTPASPVDFTYPSSNGETGVSTDPTFTWVIAENAGDKLGPGIDDEETGSLVYYGGLVPMTTLSWSPGTLEPDHDYHLDVTVSKVKDWAGPDNLPTMVVEDDEFTYYLTFDYINTISFTTVDMPPEDAVDIDWIQFKIEKNYTAGTPETEPFDIGALVFGSNLNSVQVTSPTGITEVLEPESDYWKWDREERYVTLEELYDEFPPGDYLFEFNKGEESEDSAIISFEPEQQPTGFGNVTYPADGATNVELNPTYEWDSCSGYGDNLFVVVENDEDEYWDTLDIEQISWNPGPLAPEHPFKFEITVQNIGEMPGTTENGDAFNFIDVFQWTNEIAFTTQSSGDPVDEIEEILDLVDESVEDGTLTGEGPGNSADNRLNALRNKLEEAQGLIEAGLHEEACDQLWSIYRKCDGNPRPPDFVTGDAANDLADMILLMMDELGC